MNQNGHEETAKFTTTVNGETKSKNLNLHDTMRNLISYLDNNRLYPDDVFNSLLRLKPMGLDIKDLKDNDNYIILNGQNKSVLCIESDDADVYDEYNEVPRCVYIFVYPEIFKKPFKDYIYKVINNVVLNFGDETAEHYIKLFKEYTHLNEYGQYMMEEELAGVFMDIISRFQ